MGRQIERTGFIGKDELDKFIDKLDNARDVLKKGALDSMEKLGITEIEIDGIGKPAAAEAALKALLINVSRSLSKMIDVHEQQRKAM